MVVVGVTPGITKGFSPCGHVFAALELVAKPVKHVTAKQVVTDTDNSFFNILKPLIIIVIVVDSQAIYWSVKTIFFVFLSSH